MQYKFRTHIHQVHINKVVQFLTYSDIMIMSGWGLITPIFAVYLTHTIPGVDLKIVGLASTTYFIVKSVFQIPFARIMDERKGEWDDYISMILGSIILTFVPLLYIGVDEIWKLFAVQILYGFGSAIAYPSWLAIFTRHIDKNQEGLEWSLYHTSTDLGAALSASIGGFIAADMGFNSIFVVIALLNAVGTIFLLAIRNKVYLKR